MQKRVLIAGLLILLCGVSSSGQAWKDKYLEAQASYSKENYDQSFTLADESLKKYLEESGAVSENYAAILRLLSTISFSQQKWPQGLEYVVKEIQVRGNLRDTTYAVALANKAQFEEQLGEYEKAANTLTEARQILTQYYKEDDIRVLECNTSLAINYYLSGDYAKAREWFASTLKAVEKKEEYTEVILEAFYYSGLLHLETGMHEEAIKTLSKARELYSSAELTNTLNYPLVLYGLAHAYHRKQSYTDAENSYQESQSIYENLAGKQGDDYFTILNARAVNLHHLDKHDQAEVLLNQLRSTPEGKHAYASALANIAAYYQSKGDFVKAEALYTESLSHFNKTQKESLIEFEEASQNLAMMQSDRGDQTAALARLTESKAVVEKLFGTNHRKYLNVLVKLGIVQTRAGHEADAETSFKSAFQLMATLPGKHDTETMMALTGRADLELKKGNFLRADSLYLSVIKLYESGEKPKDRYYPLALNNLAVSKQSQGFFGEGVESLKKAVQATGSISGKSSLAYGVALENLGLLCLRTGDLTTAKSRLDSAIVIYEQTSGKESAEYSSGLMGLGRYYQVVGDYTKAEPYLRNAREILKVKKGEQSPEYALVLNSLALLYQTLGNYKDAESLLKDSKAILEKKYGKSHASYSTAVQNLASLYQLEGKFAQAEPLLKEALEIDKKTLGENHPHYAITLQNMATLYQKLGKRAEAQVMLERVLQSNAKTLGKNHPSYITTLSNLAALYQDKGEFALAESTWKQSVELRKQVLGEDHPDYARSLFGLAGVYHAQGQLDKAKEYYEPVVTKYQSQVKEFFPSLSEKEKSAFYAKIKPVFDAYQDFCVQYIYAHPAERAVFLEKLYDLQLSTKAILLNASNKVRQRIQASGDKQLQDLFKEWLATKEEIVRTYNYSQAERAKFKIDMGALESRANDLEKKLSAQSDLFRSLAEKENITWKEVRNALGDNEAAVEIIRIKKKYTSDSIYYAGLILKKTSESPDVVVWTRGLQLEGRKFKYHRNTIKFHIVDSASSKMFWAPLEEKLQKNSVVYLSCDGVFNKVNFNSLFNPASKRFVIDDFTIRLLSNTRELVEAKGNVKGSGHSARLFGFADFNLGATDVVSADSKRTLAKTFGFEGESIPVLPATEKEVDEVVHLLLSNQWEAKAFKKSDATEENIKQVQGLRLIHIATHGFFLSDLDISDTETELVNNPLFRSGVLLAGAGVDRSARNSQEDGVLTAYEAMNLNLDQTDLVVLSACETGLGEVRNGEGVYGLQRSFLVAGAKTVLMSLWQVDDVATQQLMNSFYSHWVKGTDKHEAFRKAQLEMKEKYQVPYFWGAFVLIGI